MTGAQEQRPRDKRALAAVNAGVGDALGKLYTDKYFPASAKAAIQEMVTNIKAAFARRIDAIDWMDDATKQEAKHKVETMEVGVGYPDHWLDYSGLEVSPDTAYANKQAAEALRYRQQLDKIGKPLDRKEWWMNAQLVNAVNLPVQNALNFPAGILQPPFFNLDADDAINYGAIGAVIGHEISHGFDDQGRKSDGDGNLRDWWTAEDAKKFEERATRLGAQFESYTPLPGLKINGRQTMGENIGDLSGIAVALRAYHISLNGKTAPVIGGFTGDQRFFLGYAQIWRFKSRDEALRNQLLTDAHSPGYYRAFVPLTNIDTFYTAFNLKSGDKLYRAPEDRVKIW